MTGPDKVTLGRACEIDDVVVTEMESIEFVLPSSEASDGQISFRRKIVDNFLSNLSNKKSNFRKFYVIIRKKKRFLRLLNIIYDNDKNKNNCG